MPVVVLIGGGHAAGKSTTAKMIRDRLHRSCGEKLNVSLLDMQNYLVSHHDPTIAPLPASLNATSAITVSPDRPVVVGRPSRFDFAALANDIQASSATVCIVHGLYALYDKCLLDLSHIKVFISGDADTRLIRWIRRDVLSENPSALLDSVINTYLHGSKQEMSDYIFPTKERADVIMPRGAEENAVSLIVDGLLPLLSNRPIDPPANVLRPSDHLLLDSRFDSQKGTFYELS